MVDFYKGTAPESNDSSGIEQENSLETKYAKHLYHFDDDPSSIINLIDEVKNSLPSDVLYILCIPEAFQRRMGKNFKAHFKNEIRIEVIDEELWSNSSLTQHILAKGMQHKTALILDVDLSALRVEKANSVSGNVISNRVARKRAKLNIEAHPMILLTAQNRPFYVDSNQTPILNKTGGLNDKDLAKEIIQKLGYPIES